eukprot:GHVT01001399.1.p3 GENE.GHVT01001399.1~~GHVT01001399.1.p3  ORF type:complete len:139 (-),score=18.35 GHVT01001399.1:665-1081(-)
MYCVVIVLLTCQEEGKPPHRIEAAIFSDCDSGLTVISSRNHRTPATEEWLAKFKDPHTISMGSSLKLMLIAEGKAHVYPRVAPTSEWDTCAAHAVLKEAGGEIFQLAGGQPAEDGIPLRYNKENILNPFFVAYGNRQR